MNNPKRAYNFNSVPFNSLEWCAIISDLSNQIQQIPLAKPFDETQISSLRVIISMITHPRTIERMQKLASSDYENNVNGYFLKFLNQVYNTPILICLNNFATILKNKTTFPSYKSYLLSPTANNAQTNHMKNPYLSLQQLGFFQICSHLQIQFKSDNYRIPIEQYYSKAYNDFQQLYEDKLSQSLQSIMENELIPFIEVRQITQKLRFSKFFLSQDLPELNDSQNIILSSSQQQEDFFNAMTQTSFPNIIINSKSNSQNQPNQNLIKQNQPSFSPQKLLPPQLITNQQNLSISGSKKLIIRPSSPNQKKLVNLSFSQNTQPAQLNQKKIFEKNVFDQESPFMKDSRLNQSLTTPQIQSKPQTQIKFSTQNQLPDKVKESKFDQAALNFYSNQKLNLMMASNQLSTNNIQLQKQLNHLPLLQQYFDFTNIKFHPKQSHQNIINQQSKQLEQHPSSEIKIKNTFQLASPTPAMSNFFDDSDLPPTEPIPEVPDDIEKSIKNIEVITSMTDSPFAQVDSNSFAKLTQGYFLPSQFQQSNSTQKLSLQNILQQMKSVYSASLSTFEFSELAETLIKYPLKETNNEIVREFVFTHYLMQHAINFCYQTGPNGPNPQISELMDADLKSPTLRTYLQNLIEKIHDQIITKRLKAFLEFSFVDPPKPSDLTISQLRNEKASLPSELTESEKLKQEVRTYLTPMATKFKTFNSIEEKLTNPVAGCMSFYFDKTQDERIQLIDACQITFASYIDIMKRLKNIISLYVEKFFEIAITDQFGIRRGVPLNRSNFDTIRVKKDGSWEYVVVNAASHQITSNYCAWNYLYKLMMDIADTHLTISLLLQIQLIENFASDENSALVYSKLVFGKDTTAQDIQNLKDLLADSTKKRDSPLFLQNATVDSFRGQVCQLIQITPDRFQSITSLALIHTDTFLNRDGSFKSGITQEMLSKSTRTGANVSNLSIGLVNSIVKLIESYYQIPLTKGSQGEKEQQVLNLLKMNSPFTPEAQYTFFTVVQSNSPLSSDVTKLKSQLQGSQDAKTQLISLREYLKNQEEKKKKNSQTFNSESPPKSDTNFKWSFKDILGTVMQVVSAL